MTQCFPWLDSIFKKIEELKDIVVSKNFICTCKCHNALNWTLIICVIGGILIIAIFANIIVRCIRNNELRKEKFDFIRGQINRLGSSPQENTHYEILVSALEDI